MPSIYTTNGSTCATSTHLGATVVITFPDVCRLPGQGGTMAPIPYPTAEGLPAMGEKRMPPITTGGTVGLRSNISHTAGNEAGTLKEVGSFSTVSGGATMVAGTIGAPSAPPAVASAALALTLRNRLSSLHGQLSTMPGSDPNRWHALVDDYVRTVADLYIALAAR